MELKLRKFLKFLDKTYIEGGKKAKEPVLLVSVAAVIQNPWAGKGFVEDLKPEILDLAPKLGDILVPELIKEIGSGDKILAYGKAAMVGLNGEIEHASAFIHTLRFGNKFRDAVEAALKCNKPSVVDVAIDPKALYSFRRDTFQHRK